MQPGILQRAPSMLGPHRQALREEAKCFERSFSQKGSAGVMASAGACGGKGDDSSPLAGVVKHKILSFRDVLDLPTRNAPDTLDELLLGTLEDLRKLYPRCASGIQTSNINRESIYEVLLHFYEALKMVGDIWAEKCNQKEKFQSQEESIENLGFEQLGERVLERLDIMSSEGKCTFDLMEKDPVNTFVVESGQGKMYYYGNPLTPTSVLPETPEANSNLKDISNIAYVPPLLRPLRLQAVGKLKPIDVKRLSFHMFPVVLDQNSQPLHEGKKSADDRELKPLDASMIVQPNPTDETGNGDGTRHSEARTLVSTPSSSHGMQLRKQQPPPTSSPEASPMLPSTPNTQPPMSTGQVPRVVSKNCCGDDIGKSSEATVPVSPSLPISNLRATLPSATPTPPPSPMLLNGLPMFFRSSSFRGSDMEPIAYAITMDDYDQVGYGELYEAVMEASPPNQSMTPPPPSSILTTNEASLPTTSALPPEWSAQSSIPSITENRSKPSSIEFLAQKSPATVSPSPPPPPPLPPPPNRPSLSAPCPSQPSKGPTPPAPPPPPPRIGSASSAPPPPPPLRGSASSAPSPPPPPRGPASSAPPPPPPPFASSTQPQNGSGPPPPPPVGVARTALRAKKASTKLKRSTQMGNLYRLLKGKVEGSCLDGKTSQGRKGQVGCSSNGKKGQGMADALAEMTKRSAYFQQIEEDVKKHAASILEMKSAINSFKTKDMKDLIEFHQLVEQHLENLSDETQVLARFEGFPYKKLETIRMAVALYSKLDGVVTTLRSWKLVAPIAQQLNKVECYFNKIKEEMDMIERKKDEESKRFQSNNIDFDFGILIRIKESMVDLSSSCIEMALKESKEAKEMGAEAKPKSNGLSKMLWRAFQLAFRVYNFAGGQDDRADRLTSELAHEIETNQS